MRTYDDFLMESYQLREKMVADKFRPKYHWNVSKRNKRITPALAG